MKHYWYMFLFFTAAMPTEMRSIMPEKVIGWRMKIPHEPISDAVTDPFPTSCSCTRNRKRRLSRSTQSLAES